MVFWVASALPRGLCGTVQTYDHRAGCVWMSSPPARSTSDHPRKLVTPLPRLYSPPPPAARSNKLPGREEQSGHTRDPTSSNNAPLPSSQMIKQLAEQLKIAQTLQAASVAASANTRRFFTSHDEAVVVLQAGARGFLARRSHTHRSSNNSRMKCAATAVSSYDDDHHYQLALQASPESRDAEISVPVRRTNDTDVLVHVVRSPFSGSTHGNNVQSGSSGSSSKTTAALPREEGGWWTLAETEGREQAQTCTPEAIAVNALIKLQASVRSWLARNKTFAAVNARFVKHFDEDFQHPFYVCLETNRSQWNRPFGFGAWYHEQPPEPVAEVAPTERNKDEAARPRFVASRKNGATLEGDDLAAAVIAIQCALRAARARRRVAELIVFGDPLR